MADFRKSLRRKKHSIGKMKRVTGNRNVYELNKEQYYKFLKKAKMVGYNNGIGYFIVPRKRGNDLLMFTQIRGHKSSYYLHRNVSHASIERITGMHMIRFVRMQ